MPSQLQMRTSRSHCVRRQYREVAPISGVYAHDPTSTVPHRSLQQPSLGMTTMTYLREVCKLVLQAVLCKFKCDAEDLRKRDGVSARLSGQKRQRSAEKGPTQQNQ